MGRQMLGKQTEPSSISNTATATSSMSVTPSGATENCELSGTDRLMHACMRQTDVVSPVAHLFTSCCHLKLMVNMLKEASGSHWKDLQETRDDEINFHEIYAYKNMMRTLHIFKVLKLFLGSVWHTGTPSVCRHIDKREAVPKTADKEN